MGEGIGLDNTNSLKKAPKKKTSPFLKTVAVIASVCIFAACAIIIIQRNQVMNDESNASEPKQASSEAKELLLFSEPESKVARMHIQIAEEDSYTLVLQETGKYDIEEYPNYGIDEARIASMMKHSLSLQAISLVDPNSENAALYGLDNPNITAEIYYTNGKQHKLIIGNTIPTQTSVYAMIDDEPAVYELKAAVLSSFNRSLSSIHTIDFKNRINSDTITHMIIDIKGQNRLEIVSSENDLYLYDIIQPIKWHAQSVRITEEITVAIGNIELSKYIGKMAYDNDYGFSEPEAYIYAVDVEGNELMLLVGKSAADGTYIKIDDSDDVYMMNSELLSFLSAADVYHLADQFTHLVRIDNVSIVKIESKEKSYCLEICQDSNNSISFRMNDVSLSETIGRSIYQEIVSLQFDNVLSNNDLTAISPVYTIEFLDVFGKQITKVEYLPYDAAYFAVYKDGECHFIIKQTKLSELLSLLMNTAKTKESDGL